VNIQFHAQTEEDDLTLEGRQAEALAKVIEDGG
jgi:hypothetical protein